MRIRSRFNMIWFCLTMGLIPYYCKDPVLWDLEIFIEMKLTGSLEASIPPSMKMKAIISLSLHTSFQEIHLCSASSCLFYGRAESMSLL